MQVSGHTHEVILTSPDVLPRGRTVQRKGDGQEGAKCVRWSPAWRCHLPASQLIWVQPSTCSRALVNESYQLSYYIARCREPRWKRGRGCTRGVAGQGYNIFGTTLPDITSVSDRVYSSGLINPTWIMLVRVYQSQYRPAQGPVLPCHALAGILGWQTLYVCPAGCASDCFVRVDRYL